MEAIQNRSARIALVYGCLLALFTACGPVFAAAPEAGISVPGAWVAPIAAAPVSDIPLDEIRDGQYFLLVDEQVLVPEGAPVQYYSHYAIQVVSPAGMEPSSQISISFDPAYQTLQFHMLVIQRGGETIDRLPDTEIQMLRREKDLESLIYDGSYTADIILDDVRTGDVVEYAYTVSGDNPIYDGIFSYNLDTDWSVPVLDHRFVLWWPEGRMLHQKSHNTDLALSRRESGAYTIYSLVQKNVKASLYNTETPSWCLPYGFIQISETGGWAEVVNWALPLYGIAREKDAATEALAGRLAPDGATEAQKVMGALGYVQNEIRYLGIEFGVNSHKPSPPGETFRRRYGDCKDKTVALVSLLAVLGIEAYPALVNTELQHTLESWLPTIHAFNHVIARVIVDGRAYWLDPTARYQGENLEKVFQPDFGAALVIEPGGAGITPMASNEHLVGVASEETFDLRDGRLVPAGYRVRSAYRGMDAEDMRYWLAEAGRKAMEEDYLNFYAKYYEKIETVEPVRVTDVPEENELHLEENYRIPDFWEKNEEDSLWQCFFYTNAIYTYLSRPEERQRKEPYALKHPVDVRQTLRILLPDDWDIRPTTFTEHNSYFRYSSEVAYDSAEGIITLDYRYKSLRDAVAPEDLADYLSALDRMEDDLDYMLSDAYAQASARPPIAAALYWLRTHSVLAVVLAVLIVLIYCLVEWRLEGRRTVVAGDGAYFPVSLPKLFVLSIATFGLYQVFWFYRSWQYIRRRDDSHIMPFWRAVFTPVWFFPFYLDLKRDSRERFGKVLLPAAPWAVLLLLLFVGLDVLSSLDGFFELLSLLNVICLLPFANYILHVNRGWPKIIRRHAAWRPRHYLMAVVAAAVVLFNAFSLLGWVPSGEVVPGRQVPSWDRKFMQRGGFMDADARLIYFYSDAFLFTRNDGNGVTDRSVFSYWHDEERGGMHYRTARYEDIDEIRVNYADDGDENTVITVVPKNGSTFVLFASGENKKDRNFVKAIEDRLTREE
jgi:transglutaminase-like putative cysteine protease